MNDNELILGPFQGKPACIRIKIGEGVCGTAIEEKRAIIVENVHKFPGHIACDSDSKSELVIPLKKGDNIIGVLDIDSPIKARFNKEDRDLMKIFIDILLEGSDFDY